MSFWQYVVSIHWHFEPYQYEGVLKSDELDFDTPNVNEIGNNCVFFPNPANDYVIIDYFSTSEANEIIVKVSDVNGRTIKSVSLQKAPSSNTIDLRSFDKGVFLFSIYEDGVLQQTEKVTHY